MSRAQKRGSRRPVTQSFCLRRLPLACLISSYLMAGLATNEAWADQLLVFTRVQPVGAAGTGPTDASVPVQQPAGTSRRVAPSPPTPSLSSRTAAALPEFRKVTSSESVASPPAVRPQAVSVSQGERPVTRSASTTNNHVLPGVSALALANVPSRVARRTGQVVGPSEAELRAIFFRAVQAAAERSPQVQRAQAEYQAAEADIDEAKGQRWPQVDVGSQSKTAQFGAGSDNDSGGSGGVTVNVTTPIYDWGRISKTIESRKFSSQAATSTIQAELESSAFEVSSTMVELGKQRLIVDISQQFVDRMGELVKMLAGIVAVDPGRSSELTQAKARLLQAEAARDSAESRARDAEINLQKLVGPRPLMIPRTKEWNLRLANLDALLAQVEDHPVIDKAKAESEAAELQAQVVRSSSLPQLNWVVSKSTADDALGREQPWQTSLAISWSAFRGGSTRAAERAALQRAEASRQLTEQQRLDLEYRIRTANHDARTFLERAELYRDLSTESDRIRRAFYEQWYHLGRRTLLDVLTAENDHYGNQVSEITNRFDGYQAVFRQYAGAGALVSWLSRAQL